MFGRRKAFALNALTGTLRTEGSIPGECYFHGKHAITNKVVGNK